MARNKAPPRPRDLSIAKRQLLNDALVKSLASVVELDDREREELISKTCDLAWQLLPGGSGPLPDLARSLTTATLHAVLAYRYTQDGIARLGRVPARKLNRLSEIISHLKVELRKGGEFPELAHLYVGDVNGAARQRLEDEWAFAYGPHALLKILTEWEDLIGRQRSARRAGALNKDENEALLRTLLEAWPRLSQLGEPSRKRGERASFEKFLKLSTDMLSLGTESLVDRAIEIASDLSNKPLSVPSWTRQRDGTAALSPVRRARRGG
jgi:hypothetical protein